MTPHLEQRPESTGPGKPVNATPYTGNLPLPAGPYRIISEQSYKARKRNGKVY